MALDLSLPKGALEKQEAPIFPFQRTSALEGSRDEQTSSPLTTRKFSKRNSKLLTLPSVESSSGDLSKLALISDSLQTVRTVTDLRSDQRSMLEMSSINQWHHPGLPTSASQSLRNFSPSFRQFPLAFNPQALYAASLMGYYYPSLPAPGRHLDWFLSNYPQLTGQPLGPQWGKQSPNVNGLAANWLGKEAEFPDETSAPFATAPESAITSQELQENGSSSADSPSADSPPPTPSGVSFKKHILKRYLSKWGFSVKAC